VGERREGEWSGTLADGCMRETMRQIGDGRPDWTRGNWETRMKQMYIQDVKGETVGVCNEYTRTEMR
jgi:hypothetical protein